MNLAVTTLNGVVERATVSAKETKEALRVFSERVLTSAEHSREQNMRAAELYEKASAPLRSLMEADPQAMAALRELDPVAREMLNDGVKTRQAPLKHAATDALLEMLEMHPGAEDSVLAPPYDVEWTAPGGLADRRLGTFRASADQNGPFISGAGLGVFLTSPAATRVRLSAHLALNYECFAGVSGTAAFGQTNSAVLTGILVARDDGEVTVDLRWLLDMQIVNGPFGRWGIDTGDVYIGNTPIGNPEFQMEAGRTYAAWHYGLVDVFGPAGFTALGRIDGRMPFIVVHPLT